MDILLLMDKSGSMEFFAEHPVNSLNNVLRDIAEMPNAKDTRITIATFNSHFDYYCIDKPLLEISLLNKSDFIPESETALYDAMHIITKDYLERREKTDCRPVMFFIITDGMDTFSSTRRNTVFNELRALKDEGWQIHYLGTNQEREVEEILRTIVNFQDFNCDSTGISSAINSISGSIKSYSSRSA